MSSKTLQFASPPEGYEGPLKWIKFHGHIVPYNASLGVTLKWFNHIRGRVTKKLSTKIIIVGEAGLSKTYTAICLAMLFDQKFSVNQVIFGHKDYLKLTVKLPTGRGIVLDEPSYVIGKREWWHELNQILVQSIESDRYKVHPLYIPIISKDLLDKTVREHLIQFMIIMKDLGKGTVYRLTRDHFNDRVLYNFICNLRIYTPIRELSTCGRVSCLGCRKLPDCNKYIWPQYERKRNLIQTQRYKEGITRIEVKEQKQKTYRELFSEAIDKLEEVLDEEGKVCEAKLMYILNISDWRARKLRERLNVGIKRGDIKIPKKTLNV